MSYYYFSLLFSIKMSIIFLTTFQGRATQYERGIVSIETIVKKS